MERSTLDWCQTPLDWEFARSAAEWDQKFATHKAALASGHATTSGMDMGELHGETTTETDRDHSRRNPIQHDEQRVGVHDARRQQDPLVGTITSPSQSRYHDAMSVFSLSTGGGFSAQELSKLMEKRSKQEFAKPSESPTGKILKASSASPSSHDQTLLPLSQRVEMIRREQHDQTTPAHSHANGSRNIEYNSLSASREGSPGMRLFNTSDMSRSRPDVDSRSREIERQSGSIERHSGSIERHSGSIERHSGSIERHSGSIDRRTPRLHHRLHEDSPHGHRTASPAKSTASYHTVRSQLLHRGLSPTHQRPSRAHSPSALPLSERVRTKAKESMIQRSINVEIPFEVQARQIQEAQRQLPKFRITETDAAIAPLSRSVYAGTRQSKTNSRHTDTNSRHTETLHQLPHYVSATFFTLLEDSLLMKILSFLDPQSLNSCARVCQKWREAVRLLWQVKTDLNLGEFNTHRPLISSRSESSVLEAIAKTPSVTSITLPAGCSPLLVAQVANVMGSRLQALTARKSNVTDAEVEMVLAMCPNLFSLEVPQSKNMTERSASVIANYVNTSGSGRSHSLRVLDLSGCNFSASAVNQLLTSNSRLEELWLQELRGIQTISATNKVSNLKLLHLGWAIHLTSVQLHLGLLQELDLSNCLSLETAHLQLPLATTVSLQGCGDLKSCTIAAPKLAHFNAAECKSLHTLECLSLKTGATERGSMAELQSVNLFFCRQLSAESVETLCRSAPNIQHLNLNTVTRMNALNIGSIDSPSPLTFVDLAGCESLETVKLVAPNLNSVPMSGMSELREVDITLGAKFFSLKKCERLIRVTLRGAALERVELNHNAQLTHLGLDSPALRILSLSHCHRLTDSGLIPTISATRSPSLQVLDLESCRAITRNAILLIKKGNPRLHVREA